MPELPEVETTRRGIEPHLIGQTVSGVVLRESRLRWRVADNLRDYISGESINRVVRRAKYLFLCTNAGRLMLHLGMSGSLRVLPRGVAPERHDHVDIEFQSGIVLRYRDPRRFGSIIWLAGEETHPLLKDLGPEPLSSDFSSHYIYRKSRGRRTAVKTLIMNSRVVVGVGNIYANEALFRAGIRPDRLAMRVSIKRYEGLVEGIKSVLREAIVAGGTTLQDFFRENGTPGYFKSRLDVYGRKGQPCVKCGVLLKEIRQVGRSTVFCKICQR